MHPSLNRIIKAAGYSWQGLTATYKSETAFRQEVYLSAVLIPLAFWLGDNGIEYALLIGSVLLILIVEIINSAIESTINRISVQPHELSGRAKDQGSAAVLLAFANALLVWLCVIT